MSKLNVTTSATLQEVTDHLTKKFSHLKLEFFKKPHEDYKGNVMDDRLELSVTVGDAGGVDGEFEINGGMTVADLEHQLKSNIHLNAQVFRKSGKVWLETTTTDDWTLEDQNARGEEAFN